jgi:hypothetical protein
VERGLIALEARLDRLGLALMAWWVWPAALLTAAIAVLVGGWALQPGPHETVLLLGRPAFGTCGYLAATGLPCGQCGTTRALLWAARGHWLRAITYQPAAFAAWGWLMAGGLVGAARLVRRDPTALRARPGWLATGAIAWVVLYAAAYGLRLAGVLPLPTG